jgi:hypothetical protein
MILYHRTNPQAAGSILKNGFKDGTGNYLTTDFHSGVWLSDRPLDENEGAFGDVLLEVTFAAAEHELRGYEWVEEGWEKGYREFLIPAALLNPRITVRIADDRRQYSLPA